MLAQHAEAVGKPLGNEELPMVVGTELDSHVLPVGGTVLAQIDRYIQHRTFDTGHEFGLRVRRALEMQSAHHAVARGGEVVLYKAYVYTRFAVALFVVCLLKEPAGVVEHPGFDDKQSFYGSLDDIHFV